MKVTISANGRIVLPAELRRQDRIAAGQEFEIERLGPGKYRLKRASMLPNEGVVDWLLACPEKGFFVPIAPEPSGAP
jgi:AbrB family looped-hinge helix DNA binding protein